MAQGLRRTRTEVYSPVSTRGCILTSPHECFSPQEPPPTKEQSILGLTLLTYAQLSALCPSRTPTGASPRPPSPALQADHCSSAGVPLLRPDVMHGMPAASCQALSLGLHFPQQHHLSSPTTSRRCSVRLCGGHT